MYLAPDCVCEPGGACLLLQAVLMVYAAGTFSAGIRRVLITLPGSRSPNWVGAHKASLAAQALSLGKNLAGQGTSKVPLGL